MSGGWLAFGGVFVLISLGLWAAIRGAAILREEIDRIEKETWEDAQDDMRLRDIVLANDVRSRVDAVADRVPSTDEAGTVPEKRRGRRGPV